MTITEEVLKLPGPKALIAIYMEPTDPVTDDTIMPQFAADRFFVTEPDSVLHPSTSFKNIVSARGGLTFRESLTKPGELTGSSEFTAGRIRFEGDGSSTDDWLQYDWNGRPFTVWLGAEEKADGDRMELADFDVAGSGLMDELRPLGDNQFELTFADLRLEWQKELSQKLYRGFGGAVFISTLPGLGVYLRQDHAVAMDITGELTIHWVGIIQALQSQVSPAATPLIMNGANSPFNVNYGLFINDIAGGDTLAFGSNTELLDSGFSLTPLLGKLATLQVRVASDGKTVTFTAGEDGDDLAEVGSGVLAIPLASGQTDGMQMGQPSGSLFSAAEVVLFTAEKTFEDLVAFSYESIVDSSPSEIKEQWRFEEGKELGPGPERVFGRKGLIDLKPVIIGFSPPLRWVTTHSGDTPDVFAGSLAGKSRAQTYGPVANVGLARVDTQRSIYGWDSEVSSGIGQIRVKGVPMVPELKLESTAIGDFTFTAATNTVTITNPAIGSFARLIPGQEEPPRLGQRVKIERALPPGPPEPNRGIFRVAVDGVSLDGLTMTLADILVVDEAAPADLFVQSYEPDGQYTDDLSHSAVAMRSNRIPEFGEITADVVGRLPVSGLAKWTDLFELITGSTPDTSAVTLDGTLGFHLTPGSGMTTNQVLDEMAKSCFGWWIEELGGGYRLGNWAPPVGPATATISSPGSDRLTDVDPLKSLNPFWRFDVRWGKIWKTQSADGLATSVTEADKQRWGQEFSTVTSSNRTVLDAYPQATEHAGFDTWLVEQADVLAFRDLASAMLSVKRRWFKLRFPNLWAWDVQLHDVINVTWDDPTLGLIGVDCRVTSRSFTFGDYTMELEVHT